MIWLTWRQFRTQAVVAAAALAVLAVILLITGLHVAHAYDTSQVPGCGAHHDCSSAAQNYIQSLRNNPVIFLTYYIGLVLVYLIPAIVGAFWGAPLVARELETGTLAMVWNQSVSRSRWLVTKLVVLGLSGMALAGLLSLIMSWWIGPIARAGDYNRNGAGSAVNRFLPLLFGAGGIAPVGYAAFAFALGVTAGVLIRRTLPALAVTLAVFAAVQVVMPVVIRPHLISPVQATSSFNVNNLTELLIGGGPGSSSAPMTVQAAAEVPGAWLLSNETITRAGKVFDGPAPQLCVTGTPQACNAWVGRQHLRQRITYQPGQPVLGLPVDRDGDLPRPRARAGQVLTLAGQPPPARVSSGPGAAPARCRHGTRSALAHTTTAATAAAHAEVRDQPLRLSGGAATG